MVVTSFSIYVLRGNTNSNLQFIVYFIFLGGLLWTLFSYKNEVGYGAPFKDYFLQGFKCFIVVSLLMVLFTWAFIIMHPELKEQSAAYARVQLLSEKDLAPSDIESRVETTKKMFLPSYLMGAVLQYLGIGALVTAIGAGFLSAYKNN